jgi:LmbE family N-acetylglucosaminyl deacetylase
MFGIASIQIRGFPDTRFETAPILDYAHEVEVALHVHRPTIVYTHHGGDLNMDHRWVHQAVVAACRPKPGSTVQFLLFYETPSATEWAQGAFQPFVPTVFQPLSQAAWDAKEKALTTAYGVEMRGQGHPRSIEAVRALAVVRGAACGKPMAEAFMPSRLVMSE